MFTLKLTITPILICLATLASRRWGHIVGGWLVALPLTAGPVVFFLAAENGTAFGAAAACGCLSGTLALTSFCLAYSGCAVKGSAVSVLMGTLAFGLCGTLFFRLNLHPILLFCLALVVIKAGLAWLPDSRHAGNSVVRSRWDLNLRMAVATSLVILITATARRLGPSLSGTLAALPIYAGTLTIFSHCASGWRAALAVLRGTLYGLAGYATFFLVLTMLMQRHGLTISFAAAVLATLIVHGCTLWVITRRAASPYCCKAVEHAG